MDNKILVYLLIAFIAYNMFLKEGFSIPATATTGERLFSSKTGLDSNKFYVVAEWTGNKTKTASQFGGSDNCSTASTVPLKIYKEVTPINAVCKVAGDEVLTDYGNWSREPLPVSQLP
jgi:hypothetical protein